MSKFVDVLREMEHKLSHEHGPFTLFALFERQDFPNRWDLVVAAPWVEKDNQSALRLFAAELKQRLPTDELVRVSRIVFLDPADQRVHAITTEHPTEQEQGPIEIGEVSQYDLPVDRGYIITARPAA